MTIDHGGLWDNTEWDILQDQEVDIGEVTPCKHCGPEYQTRRTLPGGYVLIDRHVRCPFVVSASNEGGFNSTGVCLECVIEEGTKFIQGALLLQEAKAKK
jgi:hypothetical protein